MTEVATMNINKLKPALEFILTAPTNVDGVDAQLDAAWVIYDAEVTPSSVLALISDNDRLKAKSEALRKDVERYRWLRDSAKSGDCLSAMSMGDLVGMYCDERIDAAMSKEPSHE